MDTRTLYGLTGNDLSAFCFSVTLYTLGRQFRALACPGKFNLSVLLKTSQFRFAVNVQRQLFCLKIFIANRNQGILFHIIALFFAVLNLFCQTCQTFSIKGIAGVEILHAGLIKLRQGSCFKL